MVAASFHKDLFDRIKTDALPARQKAAEEEEEEEEEGNAEIVAANPKARVNHHHANFLRRWWQLSYAREELIHRIRSMPRCIVCSSFLGFEPGRIGVQPPKALCRRIQFTKAAAGAADFIERTGRTNVTHCTGAIKHKTAEALGIRPISPVVNGPSESCVNSIQAPTHGSKQKTNPPRLGKCPRKISQFDNRLL